MPSCDLSCIGRAASNLSPSESMGRSEGDGHRAVQHRRETQSVRALGCGGERGETDEAVRRNIIWLEDGEVL